MKHNKTKIHPTDITPPTPRNSIVTAAEFFCHRLNTIVPSFKSKDIQETSRASKMLSFEG
jgi:hypothetical protein